MTSELKTSRCLTIKSDDLVAFLKSRFGLPFEYFSEGESFERVDLSWLAELDDDTRASLSDNWSKDLDRWRSDVEEWRSAGRYGWSPFVHVVDGRAFPFQPSLDTVMFFLWREGLVPAEKVLLLKEGA